MPPSGSPISSTKPTLRFVPPTKIWASYDQERVVSIRSSPQCRPATLGGRSCTPACQWELRSVDLTSPPSGSPISSTKPTLRSVPPISMLKNLPFSLPVGSAVTGVSLSQTSELEGSGVLLSVVHSSLTRKCSMSMPATSVNMMKAYPTSEATNVLRGGHLMIKRGACVLSRSPQYGQAASGGRSRTSACRCNGSNASSGSGSGT